MEWPFITQTLLRGLVLLLIGFRHTSFIVKGRIGSDTHRRRINNQRWLLGWVWCLELVLTVDTNGWNGWYAWQVRHTLQILSYTCMFFILLTITQSWADASLVLKKGEHQRTAGGHAIVVKVAWPSI